MALILKNGMLFVIFVSEKQKNKKEVISYGIGSLVSYP